eukprot:PhM_4_TR7638/c0_g1_i2/m.9250
MFGRLCVTGKNRRVRPPWAGVKTRTTTSSSSSLECPNTAMTLLVRTDADGLRRHLLSRMLDNYSPSMPLCVFQLSSSFTTYRDSAAVRALAPSPIRADDIRFLLLGSEAFRVLPSGGLLGRAVARTIALHRWMSEPWVTWDHAPTILRLALVAAVTQSRPVAGEVPNAVEDDGAMATAMAAILSDSQNVERHAWVVRDSLMWLHETTLVKQTRQLSEESSLYCKTVGLQLLRAHLLAGTCTARTAAHVLMMSPADEFLPLLWKLQAMTQPTTAGGRAAEASIVSGQTLMAYCASWQLQLSDFEGFFVAAASGGGVSAASRLSIDELVTHANELYLMHLDCGAGEAFDASGMWSEDLYGIFIHALYGLGNVLDAWKLYVKADQERHLTLSPSTHAVALTLRSHMYPRDRFVSDDEFVSKCLVPAEEACFNARGRVDVVLFATLMQTLVDWQHTAYGRASFRRNVQRILHSISALASANTSKEEEQPQQGLVPIYAKLVTNIIFYAQDDEEVLGRVYTSLTEVLQIQNMHIDVVNRAVPAALLSALLRRGWLQHAWSFWTTLTSKTRAVLLNLGDHSPLSMGDVESLVLCARAVGGAAAPGRVAGLEADVRRLRQHRRGAALAMASLTAPPDAANNNVVGAGAFRASGQSVVVEPTATRAATVTTPPMPHPSGRGGGGQPRRRAATHHHHHGGGGRGGPSAYDQKQRISH